MGFSREIVLRQNPNFKSSQIELLYNSLVKGDFHPFDDNGYVHFKIDNEEITSLPADSKGLNEQTKAIKNAQENKFPVSIQFTHKINQRNITLINRGDEYRFHLEIRTSDDQFKLFNEFHESVKRSIPIEFHKNRIDWISNYNEEVIRCETDMHHEGVLVLCSSNRLKEYYKDKEYNYDYPNGLSDLLRQKRIIAIDSKDYQYSTILERERITEWSFGYYNSIDFTDNDELLILHYGDFTMICDNHNGDYKSYGWKHIIALPIEEKKDQVMLIAKPKDEEDKRLIIQFREIDRILKKNNWLEYEGIPTHNKWS